MPMSYLQLTTRNDELDKELCQAYSDALVQQDTIHDFADVIIDVYALLHLEKLKNIKSRLH